MLIKKTKIPFLQVVSVGLLPSFLKIAIYKLKGYSIGRNVRIGLGSVIIGRDVKLADGVRVGFATIIRAKKVSIGRFAKIGSFSMIDTGILEIGEDARINEQVIVGGMPTPESSLRMGKRTIIMEYSFVNTTLPVVIGDDSGVGGHCLLFTHGSWLNELDGYPVTFAPITIGKNVWLPWRVFVMPGVTLGDRVIVGANSLVTKSVPSDSLAAGSPAKVLRSDYVNPLPGPQRIEKFRDYLQSFQQYLEYNDVCCQFTEGETEMVLRVIHTRSSARLVAMIHPGNTDLGENDVLVFNLTGAQSQAPVTKAGVTLDVTNKERCGTNALGEEFIKFLSRYGVRFNRID